MIATKLITTDQQIHRNVAANVITVGPIYIVNGSTSRRTFRLHQVSPGDSAVADNAMFYDAAIAPNSTIVLDMALALRPGDALWARADATGVTIMLHGIYYA
jgi:hypothetical protein